MPRDEVEDGMGFSGLVPSAKEELAERQWVKYRKELVALRAENERLREALKPFAFLAGEAKRLRHVPGSSCEWRLNTDDLFAARAALEEPQ